MWMVGYNEGGEFNMADHSFTGRKTRPFMPIPMTSPNNALTAGIHGNNFFSHYHHHHQATIFGDQHSKRDDDQCNDGTPVVASSRWNPTPEQLRALEDLYSGGTRTPSAEQIEQITAHLRRFGKIEGKNVFYWFQNHKARERQKRRRQMDSSSSAADDHQGHQQQCDCDAPEKKDSGASKTVSEVEQTKNWTPSINCRTIAEESVPIQRTAKEVVEECRRTDGWLQLDEAELQQRRNFLQRNGTWHMMHHLPCPPPPAPVTHLIKSLPISSATTSSIITTTPTTTVTPRSLIKTHHDFTFFISPHRENGRIYLNSNEDDHNCVVESQTLQLFPLRSDGDDGSSSENINHIETEISASAMNANLTPSQFFEFLPLKN